MAYLIDKNGLYYRPMDLQNANRVKSRLMRTVSPGVVILYMNIIMRENAKAANPNYSRYITAVQKQRYKEIFQGVEHQLPRVRTSVPSTATIH